MKILLMYEPSESHRKDLEALLKREDQIRVAKSEPEAREYIRDAEIVMGNRFFLQSLPNAKKLRWMQSNSVGVDLILKARDQLEGIVLTCSRGVYDDEMADHAVALILALLRQLHLIRDEQQRREWRRRSLPRLKGLQCLVLGWGGVGQAVASRLRPFGVEVLGVRRNHSGSPTQRKKGLRVMGPDRWRDFLPTTEILILALPLTRETDHLVGATEIQALPQSAIVVNVGRGGTLDEQALVFALRQNEISGAALDVLEEEPPPPESPLWKEPKLLLTPHVGRSQETKPYRWEALFVDNLRRYLQGEKLLNRVDLDAGY